jgi:hypothetical protein
MQIVQKTNTAEVRVEPIEYDGNRLRHLLREQGVASIGNTAQAIT